MGDPYLSLTLSRPITMRIGRGKNTYTNLALRRPTEMEFLRARRRTTGVDAAICIIALVSAVPEDVVEQLCPRDFMAACNFMSQFSED